MSTISSEKSAASLADRLPVAARFTTLRSWLLSWEIYFIALVATFLRFYQFNTTEFDGDMANLFQMARYAVTHGLIPATSLQASIGIYNLPAATDLFMLPAAFTDDPMWGAIMVGILMIVSVLLTYGFVRCYYGRGAATIAALLYATVFRAVIYSRSIWAPNLWPIFTVLFVIALFWGVVARRKGWLFPALFLLGIDFQLDPPGILMVIPLGMALLLAPGTIRWRDFALGLLSLVILYFPFLLWEVSSHFYDVHVLIQTFLHPQYKAVFDDQAWLLYQTFLNPYNQLSSQSPFHWQDIVPYLDETSLLWQLAPYLAWISQLLIYLVVASMITTFGLAVWLQDSLSHEGQTGRVTVWRHVRHYWSQLCNSPYRCGLLVLLSWQIGPLIVLSRHSWDSGHAFSLYQHYFIFLLPGPFILVGIFLVRAAEWLRRNKKVALPGYAILLGLAIATQFIGGTLDTSNSSYSAIFINSSLWQVIAVSLSMTISVFLVYSFVHRYYGQVVAVLAALMYTTLFRVLIYSSSQWNANLLPLFVGLFVMTLLWAVVAHGKGWLFPALFLLGVLMQLYPTAILMIVLVGITVRLAPGTMRWRDLVLGLLSLLIVFLPSLLGNIALVVASVVTTLVLAIWSWHSLSDGEQTSKISAWGRVRGWSSHLCNSASRCGPLVLLCWQWVPLIILLRHALPLSEQYFLSFLLPASCILIGIFLAKTVEWLQCNEGKMLPRYIRYYGVYALAGLIIIAQFIGSTAGILDIDHGHYTDGFNEPTYSPTNDLRSLRTAVTEADQLAQRHHLNRVYISTGGVMLDALQFLSTQMHTPATVFESSSTNVDAHCVVLPSVAEGPAVLLVGPYSYFTEALVASFANATLINTLKRAGGAPFLLYIVTPKPEQAVPLVLSTQDQQRSTATEPFNYYGIHWLVTRWSVAHSASPGYHTYYTYTVTQLFYGLSLQSETAQCTFTAMRAGDQVIIPFYQYDFSKDNHGATSSTIKVKEQFGQTKPIYLHDGPFTLLSFATFCRLPWSEICLEQ